MSDPIPPKRSLSEISHLFLSSVRDKQTNGSPRPMRVPPKKIEEPTDTSNQPMPERKNDLSIDLTPEEFAQVFGDSAGAGQQSHKARDLQVSAVLGSHLNGRQFERVKQYARHLALQCGRVGLIELDASEFRLMCFEGGIANSPDEAQTVETYEPRQMAEALEEMSWDIHRWIVLVPNPRTPEAKALLRTVNHWVLLSTCDHDGIVSSYRLLKGMAEGERPRLSLALLDAGSPAEAERVHQKLASVCQQFLNWPMESESPVSAAPRVIDQLVLCCRPIHDKAQLASAPQWSIAAEFIASAKNSASEAPKAAASHATRPAEAPIQDEVERELAEMDSPKPAARPIAAPKTEPAQPIMNIQSSAAASVAPAESVTEVLELPGTDPQSILNAVLKQNGDLIECPVRPPMCIGARLAISRQRGLVLLAVASQGLAELRTVGRAYRWMAENGSLLAMALPQMSIDTNRTPQLRLLIDQADAGADILQPMLGSDHVTIQAYRKLRWGARMGLFLEAA